MLDGICDYVTFIAVYAALAAAMVRQDGAWVILPVVLAGICHAAQSAAYEAQRQDYVFWAWGRGTAPAALRPAAGNNPLPASFAVLLGIYERLQTAMGGDAGFDQALQAKLMTEPAEPIRARYQARFAPAIRRWSVLSSNVRTLGIFIGALLGMPLLYFVLEIFGLSLILFILARRQQDRKAAFIAELNRKRRNGTSLVINITVSPASTPSAAPSTPQSRARKNSSGNDSSTPPRRPRNNCLARPSETSMGSSGTSQMSSTAALVISNSNSRTPSWCTPSKAESSPGPAKPATAKARTENNARPLNTRSTSRRIAGRSWLSRSFTNSG